MKALFVGFGNVGQKVAEVLFIERDKHPNLQGLDLSIVGIVTKSRGSLVNNNGIDVAKGRPGNTRARKIFMDEFRANEHQKY